MKTFRLFIIPLFILSSCTVPVNYYVRNLTNDPIEIFLIKDEDFGLNTFKFNYLNKELDINFSTYKKLTDSVIQRFDKSEVRLTILPHSTYYLGLGSNFKQAFKKAIIHNDSEPKIIEFSGTRDLKVARSFFSKYAVWFDLE